MSRPHVEANRFLNPMRHTLVFSSRTSIVAFLLATCTVASAQPLSPPGSRFGAPIEGASGPSFSLRLPSPSGGAALGPSRHVGPVGKPCLSVSGDSRPQPANPHIFEHIIQASNSCSQVIKLQVCYYGSSRCLMMTVASYARKEEILGIVPAAKQFHYEYREQFP